MLPAAFSDVFGAPPDFAGEKPKEGTRVEEGQWRGFPVILQQARDRADLVLRASLTGPRLADAGTMEELSDFFSLWPPEAHREHLRLAVGAVLHMQTKSQADSLRLLTELAPNFQWPADSTDVLFQMNRKTTSTRVADVRINRVLKWSTIQAMFFKVDSAGNGLTQTPQPDTFALQFEVDINTERAIALESGDMSKIKSELVEIAVGLTNDYSAYVAP